MSDEQQTGMPLHFRILIALVVGTVVGVAINPGAIELPDEQIPAELKIEAVDGGNGWAVDVKESSGFESVRRKFQSRESLNAALPQDDAGVTESGLPASMISVTERAVHIAEAGEWITIDYTRKHNGQPVSTTVKAGSTSELPEHWRKLHAQHGGGWKRTLTAAAKYGGDLFLRLLKMITVPLIVTSLITGVAGLDNTSRFGAMFGRTLAYYGITSILAITTGLIIVNIVRPGIGAELPGGTEAVLHGGDESLTGILLGLVDNMIPTNPLESLVSSNFLSIITFSIIFAVFLVRTGGENARVLRKFFQAAFEVMMRLTMAIISLAPYGVFCFMVYATASQGLAIFGTLAWYMLAVFLALLVHAAITLPLLVKFVAKRSPIEFARAMSPALMTAFSTASSNGTLPLTITCVEDRAKVSNKVSSFVLPLGATVNMDGTALYEAVAVLFIAQAYRGDLVLADQILVAITALLASIGAAGIPHAGLVMMAIVLQAVNLPLEAQGIIIAVDRVLDMCRTSVNVWSDSCGCAIIAGLDSSSNETSQ
jgi:proton glutamate symport protein